MSGHYPSQVAPIEAVNVGSAFWNYHSDRRLAGLQDAGGALRRASRVAFCFSSTIIAFSSRLIFVDPIIV